MTPVHYKGAANEHLAAWYYLSTGVQVYWPAAQQSGVDFVIERDGRFLKVQVKTASWNRASKESDHAYLQCRTTGTNRSSARLYDLLFIVHGTEMWEIPTSEIGSSNISLRTTNPDGKEYRWSSFQVRD